MDGDSGDKNYGDGVDDSGVNINGGDNANCGDAESIVDCGNDNDGGGGDSIGDGVVLTLVALVMIMNWSW